MIRIENLSKAFGPKTILDAASYHFPAGERVAVVGANGAGKTTLLNILCSLEESDGGHVVLPKQAVLGYLPQEPNSHPKPSLVEECISGATRVQLLRVRRDEALARMTADYNDDTHHQFEEAEVAFAAAGGYLVESRAREILVGLGFRTAELDRDPRELSGGWRMRLELAKVFLNTPDILILDEPTNHLDLPSLAWVERFLGGFRGTVIFVSHDRDLLNRLATVVVHILRGVLTPYKGNFDDFLEQREARALEEAAMAEKLRRRRETLARFVERFGAKASKAKQAQSKLKMLSRIQELESDLGSSEDEPTLSLSLPTPPACGRDVLHITDGAIGYGRPLATGLNLKVQRGHKVAVIGLNGIGKSTLLKTLAGRIPALGGHFSLGHNVSMAWFAQDQLDILDADSSALINVMRAADLTERQARTLLGAFLFRGDDVHKPVRVLSGGEKSRVGLARLMAQKANFLVLDEPTNHLDMSSVEVLANAVDEYEGTVLYVSHDRAFIDETCTHVFVMLPDGRSALFPGKLDDYERLAAQSGFPNVLSPALEIAPTADGPTPEPKDKQEQRASDLKKERQKLERQVTKLDTDLAKFGEELVKLEKAMIESDHLDYQKARDNQARQDALRKELGTSEDAWLEASSRLEEIHGELKSLGRA